MCWRVPSKVWLGLPDPKECKDAELFAAAILGMNDVLLCGFEELSATDQQAFVEHVMDKEHWARLVKPRKPKPAANAVAAEQATTDVVPSGYHTPRQHFQIPVADGAQPLAGKTFVLTGVFPEVGGGSGLNLGKNKVTKMIQSFGGRVTSAVSGKTDVLVVGKDPGMSKVSEARERPKVQLVNLKDLKEKGIEGGRLEDADPVVIGSFSAGYRNTGLALTASREAVAMAAGIAPRRVAAAKRHISSLEDDSKPPARRFKKGKKTKSKALVTREKARKLSGKRRRRGGRRRKQSQSR